MQSLKLLTIPLLLFFLNPIKSSPANPPTRDNLEQYWKYEETNEVHQKCDQKKTDPDVNRNVSQIISSKGYPVEEHQVVTSDGYILGIQRIPRGKDQTTIKTLEQQDADFVPTTERPTEPPVLENKVVLLHHGFLNSAADWVINLENQSLGYILADAGYDVWLANARGNTYSKKHQNLDPSSKEFWQFTWDEVALYDVPATIDYILNQTGQDQLHYVGHSMGTTVIFALLSEKTEYNDKVKTIAAYAPVVTLGYMTSPVKLLVPISNDIKYFLQLFGQNEFLPNDWIMKLLSAVVCGDKPLIKTCENIIFFIAGTEGNQFNETRLEVITHHAPAGTSTLTLIHLSQMVKSGNFQKYDFGKEGNIKKYGQETPPLYNIGNVTAPVALFWGLNDVFADPADVALLKNKLKNLIDFYQVPFPEWTHLDYVYGIDGKEYVHDHLLELLKSR